MLGLGLGQVLLQVLVPALPMLVLVCVPPHLQSSVPAPTAPVLLLLHHQLCSGWWVTGMVCTPLHLQS